MTRPETARFPMSARSRRFLHAALLPLLLQAPGCESLRRTAGTGQDLLENPARTAVVRAPAGVGAIAGYVLAAPFAAILVPTVWIPSTYMRNADQGDIYISPVSASFDYGHGIGAAILGVPFNAFEGLFRDEPVLPPPGTVPEERELPPGVPDEGFDFSVKPMAEAEIPTETPPTTLPEVPAGASPEPPAPTESPEPPEKP